MDWLTFIAALVDSLAWPAAVVSVGYILREQLASLFVRIDQLKYRDLEINLADVQEKANKARLPRPTPVSAVESAEESVAETVERLAAISPRAAVIEAWSHLERAIRDAQKRTGLSPQRHVTGAGLDLWVEGVISEDAMDSIQELRKIRNQAAHGRATQVTPSQATEYGYLVERLIAGLNKGDSGSSARQ